VSLKYSLDIGSFLKGEGQDPLEGDATHAVEMEASQNALSRNAITLILGLLPIAFDAEQVTDIFSVVIGDTSLNTSPSNTVPPAISFPSAVLDVGLVSQATIKDAAHPVSTAEAIRKGKGQVSV